MTIVVLEVIAAILIFVAAGSINETVNQIFTEAKDKGDPTLLEFLDGVQISVSNMCCDVSQLNSHDY